MGIGQLTRKTARTISRGASRTNFREPKEFRRKHSLPYVNGSDFAERLLELLNNGLYLRGFKRWGKENIQKALEKKGLWSRHTALNFLEDDEHLFNIGVDHESGKGKARSNFFIFVKKEGDELIVSFYNPLQDVVALSLPTKMIHKRYSFKKGDPQKVVGELLEEIDRAVIFKGEFNYRASLHNHLGAKGVMDDPSQAVDRIKRTIRDDGIANPFDFIKNAAYHHLDVLAWTAHNWINDFGEIPIYKIMRAICEEIGIVFPYATEVTMPLTTGNPNGPHHLVFMSDERAEEVQRKILGKRDGGISLISCYMANRMTLDKMYGILESLRKSGEVIVGIPHPVNYNSKWLKLKSIGLFSAVDLDHLSLESAMDIAQNADFIAAFNPSLCDLEMDLENNGFRDWLIGAVNTQGTGPKLTANAANLAIAQIVSGVREQRGKPGNSSYDPDDHRALPLSSWGRTYEIGGTKECMGTTNLTLDQGVVEKLEREGRKLTPNEFISLVSEGKIRMSAQVFWHERGGKPLIVKARTKMPRIQQQLDESMSGLQDYTYVQRFGQTTSAMFRMGYSTAEVGRLFEIQLSEMF